MCNHPNREAAMVVLDTDVNDVPTIWCDPCIAPIVNALNAGGLPTVASCCGHGQRPGRISLRDGRELFLVPDYEAATALERLTAPAVASAGLTEAEKDLLRDHNDGLLCDPAGRDIGVEDAALFALVNGFLAARAPVAPDAPEAVGTETAVSEDFRIRQLRDLLAEWGKPPGRMLKTLIAEVAAILGPEPEECSHPWHRGGKDFCPVHVTTPAPVDETSEGEQ